MRKFNVESTSPGHSDRVLQQQVRESTGHAALVGLFLAVIALITFTTVASMDNRPIHGTARCKAKQKAYREWEASKDLPHSFEAEVNMCRSSHG